MTRRLTEDFVLSHKCALFLDFDGTLVELQDDPETVHLSALQTDCLLALNNRLGGALAIISGRDLRDLSQRVPQSLWRLGNHGLYRAAPNEKPPESFADFPANAGAKIAQALRGMNGVWIEKKGPMLAIHHRENPMAREEINIALIPIIAQLSSYKLQLGNNVIEAKPRRANKGLAIKAQMVKPPFKGRVPVMIGDDTTDEDGFLAAQALGGIGIKIGAGDTAALYRLSNIMQLYKLLGELT